MKMISYQRALDIINSSNPKFAKFFRETEKGVVFWISNTPYKKYCVSFKEGKGYFKHTKEELINILINNNFNKTVAPRND